MTKLSKTQFTEQWDISRPTLNKRIANGDISVTKDDNGRVLLDASEAIRVGLTARPDKTRSQSADLVSEVELRGIKRELELTQQWLEDKKAELERLKADADYWKDLGQKTLQLTDQRDSAQKEAAAAEEKMRMQFEALAGEIEIRAAKNDEERSAIEAELAAKKTEAEIYEKSATEARNEQAKTVDQLTSMSKKKSELEAELLFMKHRGFWSLLFGRR
jgi:chromosome segregation ATPase|tara:strand:+ start:1954 stop:2607 length:654 start_codon:yes stop_codon:yes gene_type:complete